MFRVVYERSREKYALFLPTESETSSPVNEDSYVAIQLTRMFLKHSRELYSTKFPVVHAVFRLAGLDGAVEVNRIVSPVVPGARDARQFDRVLTINQLLLGPTLYRGGAIDLQLGLYASPGEDWAQRFLELAQNVSALAIQSSLAVGASLLRPVKQSIDTIIGANRLDLKVGISTQLEPGAWLRNGHLVVIASPDFPVTGADLQVHDGGLFDASGAYTDRDYIVLEIRVLPNRTDWQYLGLGRHWKQLILTASRAREKKEVEQAYLAFATAVLGNDDLTWTDRQAICSLGKARVVSIREDRSTQFLDGMRSAGDADEHLLRVNPGEMALHVASGPSSMKALLETAWVA